MVQYAEQPLTEFALAVIDRLQAAQGRTAPGRACGGDLLRSPT